MAKLNLKGALSLPLIIVALNLIVGLAAVGMLAYTKLVYKRPAITETSERDRLASTKGSPVPLSTPGNVPFDSITLNIEAIPSQPRPADGTVGQIEGKLHYATIGFSLEIQDISRKDVIDGLRPLIMDRFLSIVGRKGIRELTTVQGRYLLRTQILEAVNQLIAQRADRPVPDGFVTNIFFTQFIVQ